MREQPSQTDYDQVINIEALLWLEGESDYVLNALNHPEVQTEKHLEGALVELFGKIIKQIRRSD